MSCSEHDYKTQAENRRSEECPYCAETCWQILLCSKMLVNTEHLYTETVQMGERSWRIRQGWRGHFNKFMNWMSAEEILIVSDSLIEIRRMAKNCGWFFFFLHFRWLYNEILSESSHKCTFKELLCWISCSQLFILQQMRQVCDKVLTAAPSNAIKQDTKQTYLPEKKQTLCRRWDIFQCTACVTDYVLENPADKWMLEMWVKM